MRDAKADYEKIKEIRLEFLPELNSASSKFISGIGGFKGTLSKLQGDWLDSIWERYLKF